MKVFLTAGFDRALHVVALAELLRRDGHSVAGVLVVKALQWSRLKQRIAQQGLSSVKKAARRMLPSKQVAREPDAMQQFLEEESITHRSLSAWTSEHNVPQWSVASLNSTEAILKIEEARADLVAYGGGGILKGKFIDAARGLVLNAHSGPLPEIRGMNACEWSLLLGPSVAVTIHGIDRGIDTGPILERIPISVDVRDTIDALRSKCTVAGVRGI
ncbi:MAG: formyltransferase family protein, partial [Planctomycetota bacterium]